MAEKATFRDNLERIDTAFPGKEMLCKKDVQDFTGLNYRTVVKLFDFQGNYISKVSLARTMSSL
jgi:hypothetical protein